MNDVNAAVTGGTNEREKKLRNAREIIGNAIQPGRLCMGAINLITIYWTRIIII